MDNYSTLDFMKYKDTIGSATIENFAQKLEEIYNILLITSVRCGELGGEFEDSVQPLMRFTYSEIERKLEGLKRERFTLEEITEKLTRKENQNAPV